MPGRYSHVYSQLPPSSFRQQEVLPVFHKRYPFNKRLCDPAHAMMRAQLRPARPVSWFSWCCARADPPPERPRPSRLLPLNDRPATIPASTVVLPTGWQPFEVTSAQHLDVGIVSFDLSSHLHSPFNILKTMTQMQADTFASQLGPAWLATRSLGHACLGGQDVLTLVAYGLPGSMDAIN